MLRSARWAGSEKLTCYGQAGGGPPSRLVDLQPLAGLRLRDLSCQYNQQLRDLWPLKDMPLETLALWGTAVTDLTPLAKAPLKAIGLNYGWEQRLSDYRYGGVLRSIKSLERINGKPAAEFWKQDPYR